MPPASPSASPPDSISVANRVTAALTGLGLGSAIAWLVVWANLVRGDLRGPDLVSFYATGRLLAAGMSARLYDPGTQQQFLQEVAREQWPGAVQPFLPFVHPPYVAPLFVPLAALGYRPAYFVAAAANVAMAAGAILIATRAAGLRGTREKVAAVALAAGAVPLFATLARGQTDVLALLALAAAAYFWTRGSAVAAGALAGLALVKPQLVAVVPALFLARRAWSALAAMAAVAAALVVEGLVAVGWNAMADYARFVVSWPGGHPQLPITFQGAYSLRSLLEQLPGGRLTALFALALLVVATGIALSWRPHRPRLDFGLAVTAGVALSPYENLHDLSLLVLPGILVGGLAVTGALARPGLALLTLTAAYAAIQLSPFIGGWLAGAATLAIAALQVGERMAVRPDPVELPASVHEGPRPHRVVVLPAYRAAKTLKETVDGIPRGSVDRVLLVDDASADATVSVATALRLDVVQHARNLGYGGNQKSCYRAALAMGADVVVMLHPDNQYDPAIVPRLCEAVERGDGDIVLGSRWLGIDPASHGMPWWKRAGNRFLTWTENRALGLNLSEYHTGYRAYSRRFLEAIPFDANSNDFVFDTQVLVQAAAFGFRIGEVPAVGRYFEEASSIGLRTSVVYGLKTLAALVRYGFHRAGFPAAWLTPVATTASPGKARPGTSRS